MMSVLLWPTIIMNGLCCSLTYSYYILYIWILRYAEQLAALDDKVYISVSAL